MFTWVLLEGFLTGFSNSIQGNDFIAPWVYEEMFFSHPEHKRKCLKVEYLGQIEYDFQKSIGISETYL